MVVKRQVSDVRHGKREGQSMTGGKKVSPSLRFDTLEGKHEEIRPGSRNSHACQVQRREEGEEKMVMCYELRRMKRERVKAIK